MTRADAFERTLKTWQRLASNLTDAGTARCNGEPHDDEGKTLMLEIIGSTFYAYGSELAIRRLASRMSVGSMGYSVNLGTWYYAHETHLTFDH